MEEIGTLGPSLAVAVGLSKEETELLQEECSQRRVRLVAAKRQADLPLSVQCDLAIIGTLLPDGDGRRLAVDFVRAGAKVLLLDDAGSVSLLDAWTVGAGTAHREDGPAEWLDSLTHTEHIEAVSRAGRLLEPLALADAVSSAATFSASTGSAVSFVWIRPSGEGRTGLDEALDRLTSVVGMATVFYDAPTGDRLALVVNGDRRRLMRLLDAAELKKEASVAVIEVGSDDDLSAVAGRARLSLEMPSSEDTNSKVLVALVAGQEKVAETIRAALHRMDFSPLFWDAAFSFDDVRANPPLAILIDAQLPDGTAVDLLRTASHQEPPIPALVLSDAGDTGAARTLVEAGASDFLTWPFESGDVQGALARAATAGRGQLEAKMAEQAVDAAAVEDAVAEELSPVDTPIEDAPASDEEEFAEARPDPEPAASEKAASDDVPAHEDEETAESVEAALVKLIGQRLASGEAVALHDIGVLTVHHETSRIVHDKQGRTIVEPPKRALNFRPGGAPEDDEPTE